MELPPELITALRKLFMDQDKEHYLSKTLFVTINPLANLLGHKCLVIAMTNTDLIIQFRQLDSDERS